MSGKHIHRTHKTRNFTSLDNQLLRSRSIGFAAKGILAMMLSHSSEWEMTMERLSSTWGESRRTVKAAMRQLEAAGHVVRQYHRLPCGQMAGVIWNWHETPVPIGERSRHDEEKKENSPTDHFPGVGKPGDRKSGVREVVKHKKNYLLKENNGKKDKVFKEERLLEEVSPCVKTSKHLSLGELETLPDNPF